jgi:glycosyltransferase involved in cell wall biosynthesis
MTPAANSILLITPARNEAANLDQLIASVTAQTLRPTRWIIVDDDSTDDTHARATTAALTRPWLRVLRLQATGNRGFGAKARAFQAGRTAAAAEGIACAFIANLDADITLPNDYFSRLAWEMHRDPQLGVASGICWQQEGTLRHRVTVSLNHAVGAGQFFRRECFEMIGGYRPVTVGGVDSLAELTARMHGWKTRAFPDLALTHHRAVDWAGGGSARRVCWRAGQTEYHLGTHPLFALAKALRRWRQRPVIGSMFIRLAGYGQLWLRGVRRDAPDELVTFVQREQWGRLGWRGRRNGAPTAVPSRDRGAPPLPNLSA